MNQSSIDVHRHLLWAVIVLLWIAAPAGGRAGSAPIADKPPLSADLFYDFKPVANEDNAIINWRQAFSLKVPLPEGAKAAIKFCWTPGAPEPSATELSLLTTWRQRNREALDLFAASLAKRRAQWPERDPQQPQPELTCLPLLVRAQLFAADQLAEQGQFAAATKSLAESLHLAQLGVEGDAMFLQYLVASRVRSQVQDAMLRLADRQAVPLPLLAALLTNLPSLDAETNLYARILCAEFTRDYNNNSDFKETSERWRRIATTNAAAFLILFPDEMRRPFLVLLDPSLIALHPKPFDLGAELEKSIRHYRIYRSNSVVPWTERDNSVELDEEIARTNLAAEIAPLMELVKDESLPLNRFAVQKTRTAYLAIDNPIGRIMDTSSLGFACSDFRICQVRTEREATRACLAALIFERRKGRLPEALSDLVAEQILSAVPQDPFCGEPLHYSPSQRKIWSVSNDGIDDHGEAGESRWLGKDAVWKIPELK
jgi:hypothetical protein